MPPVFRLAISALLSAAVFYLLYTSACDYFDDAAVEQQRHWLEDAGAKYDEVLALKGSERLLAGQQEGPVSASSTSASTSSALPAPTGPSKAVVVGALEHEDTAWVEHLSGLGWQTVIYTVDSKAADPKGAGPKGADSSSIAEKLAADTLAADVPAAPPSAGDAGTGADSQVAALRSASRLHTPRNKGREANAYLYYILTHYDALPEVVVFLHSHESGFPRAWHVDNEAYSNSLSVKRLRLDTVLRRGYVNLRCLHTPGCPAEVQLDRAVPDLRREHEVAMPQAMMHLFNLTRPELPDTLAAPCCSQFAVSRDMVRRRKREEYERYYDWLMDTELTDAVSGRVMEYLWHFMFGQKPVTCGDILECYCDTYGLWCGEEEVGLDLAVE